MSLGHGWLKTACIGSFILFGLASRSLAVGWFDNFNDGSATAPPVAWETNASGFFPGTLDASTGDYIFSALGDGNDDSVIEASVNTNFTDTYVRTQAVVLPDPGNPSAVDGTLGVWARYNPTDVTGYLAILSNGGHLELLRLDPGVSILPLAEIRGLETRTDVDTIIELDAVGDFLNVYLWNPGTPKPLEPTLSVNDSEYTSGRAGILHDENDDGTLGVFRFAAAQSTPFLEGDYNNDGKVDAADYVVWRNGDAPVSTQAWYDYWRLYFGNSTPVATGVAAAAVPEPASVAMVLAACYGGIVMAGRRRRFNRVG